MKFRFFDFEVFPNWWCCVFGDLPEDWKENKVTEAIKYKTNMATAVEEGNAKAQWESSDYGYTGEGVVVAVIDTGVNYRHKDMVLDKGGKKKYSKKEWEKKIYVFEGDLRPVCHSLDLSQKVFRVGEVSLDLLLLQ